MLMLWQWRDTHASIMATAAATILYSAAAALSSQQRLRIDATLLKLVSKTAGNELQEGSLKMSAEEIDHMKRLGKNTAKIG